MGNIQKLALFLLRISMGWLMFYAGITKVIDPAWSAAGYIAGAKTFAPFYHWLLQPGVIPTVDLLNKWGLTLVGISLLLGVGVRLGSFFGAAIMLLYYFPILAFPYPDPHSFIVDEHIVYACGFFVLAAMRAGRAWGLERWCSNLPVCARFPTLRRLLG